MKAAQFYCAILLSLFACQFAVSSAPDIASSPASQDYGIVGVNISYDKTFTISNEGDANLVISSITRTGSTSEFFFPTLQAIPNYISPRGKFVISVRFKPTSAGTKSAVLHIASNDPDEPTFDIALSGKGDTPPDIYYYSAAHYFIPLWLGFRKTLRISIQNDGNADLHVKSTTITGIDAQYYNFLSGQGAFTISYWGFHYIDIEFYPTSTGDKSATLVITSDDPDENPFNIPLNITVTLAPDAACDPSSWNFGSVPVGVTVTKDFKITTPQAVNVTSIMLAGSNHTEFSFPISFTHFIGSDGYTFQLGFSPTTSGSKQAYLQIDLESVYGGIMNPLLINLSGTGTSGSAPNIASALTSWTFGMLTVGNYSWAVYSVKNTGNANLNVSNMTISGANPGDFSILSSLSFTVAPASSYDVKVKFAPTSAGVRNASLVITSDDPDEREYAISLSGTGVNTAQPNIASNSTSWNYGSVNTGGSSLHTFSISNTGNANLNVSTMTITDTDASEFSIQGGLSFAVAPGATHDVTVTFNPTSTDNNSATLNIFSNDPDEAQFTIGLNGIGTSAGAEAAVLQVPKTAVAPSIDGVLDPVWQNAAETMQQYYPGTRANWFDLWGSQRLMWDNTYLYGFMDGCDNTIVDAHSDLWQQDGWEFFIDADNFKGSTYDGVNDGQFRINHHYTAPGDVDVPDWFASKSDITFKNLNKANGLGWTVEWKIRLASLKLSPPYANRAFGWEVQQNDNDGSWREARSKWWNSSDDSWLNPGLFGTAKLVGRTINMNLDVYKTNSPPTIDGNQEDSWLQFPHFCDQYYEASNSADNFDQKIVTDWTDARYNFRTTWDNSNLYFFVKVWDNAKVLNATSGYPYESDGIELFFDGNNSKGQAYDGANDNQIRFERKDASPADLDLSLAFDKNLIHFANKETAQGWNLEVLIPLSALKINPAEGAKFGLEVQMNDNDSGPKHLARKWWNWNSMTWSNPSLMGTAELVASCGRTSSTAVREKTVQTPAEYRLAQNYPNPFNPVTTICYSLPSPADVRLFVYDTVGRKVAVLVQETKPAGEYRVTFDAAGLKSGMYFCRLEVDSRILTQKMVLLK